MTIRYQLQDIDAVAKQLISVFDSKIILFKGEMGSGKTTLISALVKALGGTSEASSPTFSIVNEYKVNSGFVYHFDLYRLKNQYEALDIGIEDYLCSGYWNFMEWPEQIMELLPKNVTTVHIKAENNNLRVIECSNTTIG